MKRKLVSMVAGGLLTMVSATGALVGAELAPASAHNQDNYSYFYCSKHRSGPEQTVTHSSANYLAPGVVGYYCIQSFFGHDWLYLVRVSPPFSNNSWLHYGYQDCEVDFCPGH